MASPSTFPKFNELPLEIRHHIWSFVPTPYDYPYIHSIRGYDISSPKFTNGHKLSYSKKLSESVASVPQKLPVPNSHDFWHTKGGVFRSTTAPNVHPVLQVCRDARMYFVQKYSLFWDFGAFINTEKDIVLLDDSPELSRHLDQELYAVEAIAEFALHKTLMHKLKNLAILVDYDAFSDDKVVSTFINKASLFLKPHLHSLEKLYFVNSVNERKNFPFGCSARLITQYPGIGELKGLDALRKSFEDFGANLGLETTGCDRGHIIKPEYQCIVVDGYHDRGDYNTGIDWNILTYEENLRKHLSAAQSKDS